VPHASVLLLVLDFHEGFDDAACALCPVGLCGHLLPGTPRYAPEDFGAPASGSRLSTDRGSSTAPPVRSRVLGVAVAPMARLVERCAVRAAPHRYRLAAQTLARALAALAPARDPWSARARPGRP